MPLEFRLHFFFGERVQLIDKRDYDQGQGVIVQVKLLAWQDAAPADAGAMT